MFFSVQYSGSGRKYLGHQVLIKILLLPIKTVSSCSFCVFYDLEQIQHELNYEPVYQVTTMWTGTLLLVRFLSIKKKDNYFGSFSSQRSRIGRGNFGNHGTWTKGDNNNNRIWQAVVVEEDQRWPIWRKARTLYSFRNLRYC